MWVGVYVWRGEGGKQCGWAGVHMTVEVQVYPAWACVCVNMFAAVLVFGLVASTCGLFT